MKHMTNLYDKEFFIDREKDMLQCPNNEVHLQRMYEMLSETY